MMLKEATPSQEQPIDLSQQQSSEHSDSSMSGDETDEFAMDCHGEESGNNKLKYSVALSSEKKGFLATPSRRVPSRENVMIKMMLKRRQYTVVVIKMTIMILTAKTVFLMVMMVTMFLIVIVTLLMMIIMVIMIIFLVLIMVLPKVMMTLRIVMMISNQIQHPQVRKQGSTPNHTECVHSATKTCQNSHNILQISMQILIRLQKL